MIVEFAGAPGSGKTTLVGQTAEELHRRGINALTIALDTGEGVGGSPGFWLTRGRLVLGAVLAPRLVIALLPLVLRSRTKPVVFMAADICSRRRLARRVARRTDAAIVLLDEGPLHQLLWMTWQHADLPGLPPHLPIGSDIVVKVVVPLNIAFERLVRRDPERGWTLEQPGEGIRRLQRYASRLESIDPGCPSVECSDATVLAELLANWAARSGSGLT